MAPIVKDVALVEAAPSALSIFERMATMPGITVDALERMMQLHERMQAKQAKESFFCAFARLQGELPAVERKGKGHNSIRYAKNDDIQEAVRPVLERFGFSLSFRTEFPTPKSVKITAVLAHKDGHDERTEFISDADTSGNKNAIQALGSTIAYGKRYATGAILNITTKDEVDDDGASHGKPEPPENYVKAIGLLSKAADKGQKAFAAECADVRNVFPAIWDYATKHDRAKMEGFKATAQRFDRSEQ